MVFYRKYRPQTLDELIGQDPVKLVLQSALKSGKLSHAYLFVGSKGTGKTSTARILAKMVNCEVVQSSENPELITPNIPCNKCQSCISITDGSNLDLVEIDAASNRGIDDIRQLRENIKLAPSSNRKKVYIIDEVHMLTTEAFNALLKTLEEPPAHVLFILATTEAHKIPQTILSRVTKLNFQQAKLEDLIMDLERVCKLEKIEIEPEALKLIAKASEGSFRDCLKNLEHLASSGSKITVLNVEETLGAGNFESAVKLIEALFKKDSNEALRLVEARVSEGVNIKELINSLMDILRLVMYIQHGSEGSAKEELGSVKFPEVLKLSGETNSKQAVKILESLQEASEHLKFSSIPALPLEIAVIESCMPEESGKNIIVEKIIQTIKNPLPEVVTIPTAGLIPARSDPNSPDLAVLKDKWSYILETVKPYNFSLEALLRQVKIVSCNDGKLLLEVPYSFHQRILEAPKSRDLLESVLADVLGKPIIVSCVLGIRPKRIDDIANIELAADDDVIQIAAEIFNSDPVT